MAFKNHATRQIITDHEDTEWIYLKQPRDIRVNKTTYEIQKRISGEWQKPNVSWCGSRESRYPAISVDYRMWSIPRIIGVLFVPNPNNYKFLHRLDNNNINPNTLEWAETSMMAERRSDYTSIEDRKNTLQGMNTSSKEYFRAYNKLKGQDGLTNSERYIKRRTDAGLSLVIKRYSPLGYQVWVNPVLKEMIMIANRNGSINDPAVKEKLIEAIHADQEAYRINKPYKRYTNNQEA